MQPAENREARGIRSRGPPSVAKDAWRFFQLPPVMGPLSLMSVESDSVVVLVVVVVVESESVRFPPVMGPLSKLGPSGATGLLPASPQAAKATTSAITEMMRVRLIRSSFATFPQG
jgi:hypothetical protein